MKEEIKKTRQYLDYLQEHYDNVQEAWKLVKKKCVDMDFMQNDIAVSNIETSIRLHDRSKLSSEELVPYRKKFYPINEKEKENSGFDEAWKHHYQNNSHHWENWSEQNKKISLLGKILIVECCCDWIAMSMKFGGTAIEYYEKNKNKIKLPKWSEDYLLKILNRVYNE